MSGATRSIMAFSSAVPVRAEGLGRGMRVRQRGCDPGGTWGCCSMAAILAEGRREILGDLLRRAMHGSDEILVECPRLRLIKPEE